MIGLVLTLALVGCLVWFVTTYVPMVEPVKKLIYVIVAICLVLYLMRVFGITDLPLPGAR